MTRHEQAEKLRAFADSWASESHGCLTLNDLGAIFGNEFWLLIVYLMSDDMKQCARFAKELQERYGAKS